MFSFNVCVYWAYMGKVGLGKVGRLDLLYTPVCCLVFLLLGLGLGMGLVGIWVRVGKGVDGYMEGENLGCR